jgi:hypothetical protein
MTSSVLSSAAFILACLQDGDPTQRQQIAVTAAAVRDWEQVGAFACRHRVSALVLEAVELANVRPPLHVIQTLLADATTEHARSMLHEHELTRIVTACRVRGVDVMLLKGAALALCEYRKPHHRPYHDLDIAVRDGRYGDAAAALASLGYHELPYAHGAAPHRIFESTPGHVLVELHLDALQLGVEPVCESARWQRAVPLKQVPGAYTLRPEDHLVLLAVHAHKHGFGRLVWLKDIDLLVRHAGASLDWDLVNSVARAEGVIGCLWLSLRFASSLLRTPLPAGTLAALKPRLVTRALYEVAWPMERIAKLDGYMRLRAVQFRPADSWRGMLPSLVFLQRRGPRLRAMFDFARGA